MKIAIIGGQLQGLEAAYLAKQAGFQVTLIDRNTQVPARWIVDEFHQLDLLSPEQNCVKFLQDFDLVLPATENYKTLLWLAKVCEGYRVPVALDLAAYQISSSKLSTNRLLEEIGIPRAASWPECGFPVIVKPSGMSGSAGVVKVASQLELTTVLAQLGKDVVIEEYLVGPSYSLEVIAHRGESIGLQVTELHFDARYDCKRVLAGPRIGLEIATELLEISTRIARAINLSGIMDIEVISTREGLKVLEIDARLPSQTPSAVYHSSGINMVELLAQYWVKGTLPSQWPQHRPQAVIFEHLNFIQGSMKVTGEHTIRNRQGMQIYQDKFGAQVLIANFEANPEDWAATVIFSGSSENQVWQKREGGIRQITEYFRVQTYDDSFPLDERGADFDQAIL